MKNQQPQVLFLTMPWATPVHPSLAIAQLSAILTLDDISCECLYGNFLLPRPQEDGGVYTIVDPGHYEDRSAGLSFVPFLYPQVGADRIADSVAERFLRIVSREGQLELANLPSNKEGSNALRAKLINQTLTDIRGAGICLERCMEWIGRGDHDIIGVSLTFETQLVASLALARRIKARWPHKQIVFGGAACVSGQGIALLKSFDCLDVVCLGEGDSLIVPLVRALLGDGDLDEVRGITYRKEGFIRVNKPVAPLHDLDWLPVPDYDSFFSQKKGTEWADTVSVLLFETSRGCWWGEKHLCSFCGLNAETLTYRSKSAGRVMREIATICQRWDVHNGIQAVDNIFDMKYFTELVPMLIEFQNQHRVGIFFEIKSNLKLNHLFQLAAAGIMALQPGIESFSDHILKLMDKGANAIQQINFIKWANQVGISSTYNILTRNPGETAEDYREMIEILPFISHLQPPNGVANMQLERYSPYFLKPDQFGIRNVRPQPHYKDMFPDASVRVDEIVYQFDFDHDELDSKELLEARRDFLKAVLNWTEQYKTRQLVFHLREDEITIIDRRDGDERIEHISGYAAEVYQFIDRGHNFSSIKRAFSNIAPSALRLFLEQMVKIRLVYHHRDDVYVALAMREFSEAEYFVAINEEVESAARRRTTQGSNRRELVVLGAA